MSAWPVSNAEIDCLVHWITALGLTKRSKDSVGKELRAENYKSLRARYGWYAEEYRKAPKYTFHTPLIGQRYGVDYDPYNHDQALKMVRFYDYQSCEHGEAYNKSQSFRWMRRLEKYLMEDCQADSSREGLTWGAA